MSDTTKIHSHNIGKISTFLSVLCSIHCITTPILAIFLPFFNTHGADWIELAIILLVFALGGTSIRHGYKSHHKNQTPAVIFIVGLIILIAGYVVHEIEIPYLHTSFMILGSTLTAVGQLYNLKLSHIKSH